MSAHSKSDVRTADREVESYEMGSPGKYEGTVQDKQDMEVLGRKQQLNVSNTQSEVLCLQILTLHSAIFDSSRLFVLPVL